MSDSNYDGLSAEAEEGRRRLAAELEAVKSGGWVTGSAEDIVGPGFTYEGDDDE